MTRGLTGGEWEDEYEIERSVHYKPMKNKSMKRKMFKTKDEKIVGWATVVVILIGLYLLTS